MFFFRALNTVFCARSKQFSILTTHISEHTRVGKSGCTADAFPGTKLKDTGTRILLAEKTGELPSPSWRW